MTDGQGEALGFRSAIEREAALAAEQLGAEAVAEFAAFTRALKAQGRDTVDLAEAMDAQEAAEQRDQGDEDDADGEYLTPAETRAIRDQAHAAGYATAVANLRDDERYDSWVAAQPYDEDLANDEPSRRQLADYLEAVGPAQTAVDGAEPPQVEQTSGEDGTAGSGTP